MRVDSSSSLAPALAGVQPGGSEVQQAVSVSVIKQSLALDAVTTQQLLQSIQPHLGQTVDVRA